MKRNCHVFFYNFHIITYKDQEIILVTTIDETFSNHLSFQFMLKSFCVDNVTSHFSTWRQVNKMI